MEEFHRTHPCRGISPAHSLRTILNFAQRSKMAGGMEVEVEEPPQLMKGELRIAIRHLSEHGLLFGAKWAAEQVNMKRPMKRSCSALMRSWQLNGFAREVTADDGAAAQRLPSSHTLRAEEDVVSLAKTYVDVKEFKCDRLCLLQHKRAGRVLPLPRRDGS
eukprot:766979-Hanusia_phi.AAC.2